MGQLMSLFIGFGEICYDRTDESIAERSVAIAWMELLGKGERVPILIAIGQIRDESGQNARKDVTGTMFHWTGIDLSSIQMRE